MQKDYSYELTRPFGDISDLKEKYGFDPDLSPLEMIELGIMGGKYFNDVVRDTEYPLRIRILIKSNSAGYGAPRNPKINYFKVNASSSLPYWKTHGLINPIDPRGWIEWFIRTWYGRRSEDDLRQIKRWKMMNRHLLALQKDTAKGGELAEKKLNQPRRRQALLHWGFNTTKKY